MLFRFALVKFKRLVASIKKISEVISIAEKSSINSWK